MLPIEDRLASIPDRRHSCRSTPRAARSSPAHRGRGMRGGSLRGPDVWKPRRIRGLMKHYANAPASPPPHHVRSPLLPVRRQREDAQLRFVPIRSEPPNCALPGYTHAVKGADGSGASIRTVLVDGEVLDFPPGDGCEKLRKPDFRNKPAPRRLSASRHRGRALLGERRRPRFNATVLIEHRAWRLSVFPVQSGIGVLLLSRSIMEERRTRTIDDRDSSVPHRVARKIRASVFIVSRRGGRPESARLGHCRGSLDGRLAPHAQGLGQGPPTGSSSSSRLPRRGI